MKKIVALLFSAVFCFLPLFVTAETLEVQEQVHTFFANYSDEELLVLQEFIEIELKYRGLDNQSTEMKIPVGEFVVGEDFPAGVYTMEIEADSYAAVVVVGNYDLMFYIDSSSPVGKCELKDGQHFSVQVSPVVLKPYEGLGF